MEHTYLQSCPLPTTNSSLKLGTQSEAEMEGRTEPGSDIFIHGRAVSIGCLAMGDETIEELFPSRCGECKSRHRPARSKSHSFKS